MERTILHVDMNSCYASIECLHNPGIRHLPVAVGGDVEARHGIILAKNEHAKKFGVKTGEALWQAKEKCPKLIIIQPHYDLYLRFSRLARQIYADYSDQIEPFGLDEAWVDVTGSTHLYGDGETIAQTIRERVKFELGITVSVGASWNKVYAKLGSDYKKPDAVTVFTRDNYRDLVWALPVDDLLYVGRATGRKLHERNVHTIGQLANTDPRWLRSWFGKWGDVLYTFANGEDPSPVAQAGDESIIKSIGNSTTTPRDLMNEQDAAIIFYMLAESVAERLREHGFLARTVQISLRDNGLFAFERQCKLAHPTCLSGELHTAAMKLLRANYNWIKPLRSIGIRGTDLVPATSPTQLTLFEDQAQRERYERLERSIDDIRRRFGHYAVCRAVCTMDKTLNNISPKDEHTIHPVGFFKAI
ncbi:MAG TPA: DNA polymerase IV [Clostridia bacterium]|nr:DNA polymerase IV [Clostridia bacterium]HPK16268.1 DNA polymerase IV [Clostridia bacterium]